MQLFQCVIVIFFYEAPANCDPLGPRLPACLLPGFSGCAQVIRWRRRCVQPATTAFSLYCCCCRCCCSRYRIASSQCGSFRLRRLLLLLASRRTADNQRQLDTKRYGRMKRLRDTLRYVAVATSIVTVTGNNHHHFDSHCGQSAPCGREDERNTKI